MVLPNASVIALGDYDRNAPVNGVGLGAETAPASAAESGQAPFHYLHFADRLNVIRLDLPGHPPLLRSGEGRLLCYSFGRRAEVLSQTAFALAI
jgi:hypothetical protein